MKVFQGFHLFHRLVNYRRNMRAKKEETALIRDWYQSVSDRSDVNGAKLKVRL